jgi:hypothetical protein
MLPNIDAICLQILNYLSRRAENHTLREKSFVTYAIRKFVYSPLNEYLNVNYDIEAYKNQYTMSKILFDGSEVFIEPNLHKDFFLFLIYMLWDLELIKGFYNNKKRFYITKLGLQIIEKGDISDFIQKSKSFLEDETEDYYRDFLSEIEPFRLTKHYIITDSIDKADESQNNNIIPQNTKKQGYVYIFSNNNPKLKGIIKAGKTQKTPEERANALNKNTGTIGKYKVEWSRFVKNCDLVEKFIHYKLEEYHYEKEFFEISVNKAIEIANKVVDGFENI